MVPSLYLLRLFLLLQVISRMVEHKVVKSASLDFLKKELEARLPAEEVAKYKNHTELLKVLKAHEMDGIGDKHVQGFGRTCPRWAADFAGHKKLAESHFEQQLDGPKFVPPAKPPQKKKQKTTTTAS